MIHPERMLHKLKYPRNQLHMSIKHSSWLYYFVTRHYGNPIPNKGFVTIFRWATSSSIVGCYAGVLVASSFNITGYSLIYDLVYTPELSKYNPHPKV